MTRFLARLLLPWLMPAHECLVQAAVLAERQDAARYVRAMSGGFPEEQAGQIREIAARVAQGRHRRWVRPW